MSFISTTALKYVPTYRLLNISSNHLTFLPICHFWTSSSLCKGLDPKWGSRKLKNKRNVKLGVHNQFIKEDHFCQELEKQLEPLKASIRKQGEVIQSLKLSGAADIDIKNEVRKLKILNKLSNVIKQLGKHFFESAKGIYKDLEDVISKVTPTDTFDRARMDDLVKRKFYFATSFDIYGGSSGLYDYGPLGCQIMENLVKVWNWFFVVQEGMLKVNCPSITPEVVLRATGHVDKFVDVVVKGETSGRIFRLDHLIRSHLEALGDDPHTKEEERHRLEGLIPRLDGMGKDELGHLIREFNIKCPVTGDALSEPAEMNLMFPVTIGSSSSPNGFLRPETAQGIFSNFRRLLDLKQGRLPFACAQVGSAFRNELSPQSGLLRVREFMLAEIEHFCFPDDKSHPKFHEVFETELWLYSACDQLEGGRPMLTTVGDAVRQGLVGNETLGFYLARIQQFLLLVGIDPLRVRFRQHLSAEMAHYAADCWDAECLTSHGWVECVGVADRSAYDLSCHARVTGTNLCAERPLEDPRLEERLVAVVDKEALQEELGRKVAKKAEKWLRQLEQEDLRRMADALDTVGSYQLAEGVTVTKRMVPGLKTTMEEVYVEKVIPSVVEPSFGMGRIFLSLLEHSFRVREDDRRTYFALPSVVAPVHAAVLAVVNLPKFTPFVRRLANDLTQVDMSVLNEPSRKSLGRQYVDMDEKAVPFCITVDEDTLRGSPPGTVTLRERDSTQQVRMPIEVVAQTLKELSQGKVNWEAIWDKWPKFVCQETKDDK